VRVCHDAAYLCANVVYRVRLEEVFQVEAVAIASGALGAEGYRIAKGEDSERNPAFDTAFLNGDGSVRLVQILEGF
jgi:hypothetical protein